MDSDHAPKEVGESKSETKVASFRIPRDLYVQLQALKEHRSHPLIADTAFFIESLKLYVALGMEYGLTSDLQVEGIDALLGKTPPKRANSTHPR